MSCYFDTFRKEMRRTENKTGEILQQMGIHCDSCRVAILSFVDTRRPTLHRDSLISYMQPAVIEVVDKHVSNNAAVRLTPAQTVPSAVRV